MISICEYTDVSVILTTLYLRLFLSTTRYLINKMNFEDLENRNYNK